MSWQTLPNGILLKNADTLNTLNDTYNADIAELGYNRHEIYPRDNFTTNPMIIGYFKLLTNELIAIHRDDNETMYEFEIDDWLSELYEMRERDEEDLLQDGIDNGSISQAYIESICGVKARNNTISNGKYVFHFSGGVLTDFERGNGISADANDFLNVDAYIQEARLWYNGDMRRIINEVNLHASCLVNMDYDILRSSSVKLQFAYPNGYCNYIAVAAHFKTYDVDFEDVLNSTHGKYEVVEKNALTTKIRAYGEIFSRVENVGEIHIPVPEEAGDSSYGYVYVMVNPSLPDIVKIGKTTRDPNERAKELSSATGVPTPFILVYSKPFADCHFAEKVIHGYLEDKGVRVSGNREFFQISTSEAIDLINVYYSIEQKDLTK